MLPILLILLVVFAAGVGISTAQTPDKTPLPTIAAYPVPQGAPHSKAYEVYVNDLPVGVHAEQLNAYAIFSFAADLGPCRVRIVCHQPPSSVSVRPRAAGIDPQLEGDVISFVLDKPQKIIVQTHPDRYLYLFADGPETEIPDRSSPDVIWYEPGYHDLGGRSIRLKSNQTLYVSGGAYLDNFSSLIIRDAQNVRVSGRGVLAANTRVFNSSEVLIEGIVINPPHRSWMNKIDVSQHVTYRNFKALSGDDSVVNFDGFDVMSGCYDILIEDVFVRGTDDMLSLKHHPLSPGYWGGKAPTAYVTLRNAVLWNMRGGSVVRFGPETIGPSIEYVTVEDLDVLQALIGFEILPVDGVSIRNVLFKNIRVENVSRNLIEFAPRTWYKVGTEEGKVDGVYLRNWDVPADSVPPRLHPSFSHVFADQFRRGDDEPEAAWWGPNVTVGSDARRPADRVPPTILGAVAVATGADGMSTRLYVAFTEPVSRHSAQDVSSYSISPTVQIEKALLDPHFQQVILHTSPLSSGDRHTLRVSGVEDLAGNTMDDEHEIGPPERLQASKGFAAFQGRCGWWYEQFNHQQVQIYNNRTDILHPSRYWLMNYYAHVPGKLWSGHRRDATIGATQMRSGAEYWAVRTWMAPADGTVRITGAALTTAPDPSARVKIVYNSALEAGHKHDQDVWGWDPIGDDGAEHDLRVRVQSGAVVRFILAGEPGKPTVPVQWDPIVEYVADSPAE